PSPLEVVPAGLDRSSPFPHATRRSRVPRGGRPDRAPATVGTDNRIRARRSPAAEGREGAPERATRRPLRPTAFPLPTPAVGRARPGAGPPSGTTRSDA